MMKKGTIVWCDVETPGLADDCEIMEIAIIITDDKLEEIARTEYLVDGADYGKMNAFVMDMHTKSGLIQALEDGGASGTAADVETALCDFIETYCEPKTAVLAGNSVHFDQRMLRNNMPSVLTTLSHRLLDVSSIRRAVRMESSGDVDPGKPDCPHRALGDVETCIQEYKDLMGSYEDWIIEQYLANG